MPTFSRILYWIALFGNILLLIPALAIFITTIISLPFGGVLPTMLFLSVCVPLSIGLINVACLLLTCRLPVEWHSRFVNGAMWGNILLIGAFILGPLHQFSGWLVYFQLMPPPIPIISAIIPILIWSITIAVLKMSVYAEINMVSDAGSSRSIDQVRNSDRLTSVSRVLFWVALFINVFVLLPLSFLVALAEFTASV